MLFRFRIDPMHIEYDHLCGYWLLVWPIGVHKHTYITYLNTYPRGMEVVLYCLELDSGSVSRGELDLGKQSKYFKCLL